MKCPCCKLELQDKESDNVGCDNGHRFTVRARKDKAAFELVALYIPPNTCACKKGDVFPVDDDAEFNS